MGRRKNQEQQVQLPALPPSPHLDKKGRRSRALSRPVSALHALSEVGRTASLFCFGIAPAQNVIPADPSQGGHPGS